MGSPNARGDGRLGLRLVATQCGGDDSRGIAVTGAIAGIVGLLVAGFAFGRVRVVWTCAQPDRAAHGRTKGAIVLSIVAVPFMTLMLAKLFGSAVLGWVAGLTLIAGIALAPCAAIFYVGMRLGSRSVHARTSMDGTDENIVVQVERGNVHASDDAPSKRISVPLDTTLRALVALAISDRYIPSITGGKATWVVESSGDGTALRPIAVCAQQWADVVFLVPDGVSVATHFGAMQPRLNLSYRCQDDPAAVAAALGATDR